MPTQRVGAEFLAARRTALLADAPRVGKTGAALLAAQQLNLAHILIITTASGRAVWRRAVAEWLPGRAATVLGVDKGLGPVVITSWDAVRQSKVYEQIQVAHFDLAILDEDHRAGNPETKTAQAVYGRFNRDGVRVARGLVSGVERVWHLSGTPIPHDPGQMWPRLRSSFPKCLEGDSAMPDVTAYEVFRSRYCVIRMKQISRFNAIPVVVGGRNLPELKARIGDWMLRRTQADVGIQPPVREMLPLIVSAAQRREIAALGGDESAIIQAIDAGLTKSLDMQLGTLRRLTGRIKARAVIAALEEEFESGLEKIVLAFYHREVGDILESGLHRFNPVRVDGETTAGAREDAQTLLREAPTCRVFLAQLDAASEAIDLSAADTLWFVETSFSPKTMQQMGARISNVSKAKNTYVKVCAIEGSIDEAIQASLLRLWSAIREVIG